MSLNTDLFARWKSLQLKDNKPVASGLLSLVAVHHCRPVRDDGGESSLEFVDAKGACLLRVRGDSGEMRGMWVRWCSELLTLYAEEIKHRNTSASLRGDREARMAQRREDIAHRREKAKEKIKALGLVGMQHSAQARASR